MLDSLGRKERGLFCYVCKNITYHVLIDNKWCCECCNPLLSPDPILLDFTIEEFFKLRGTNHD